MGSTHTRRAIVTPPTIHSDPVINRILGLNGFVAPSTVVEAQGAYQADPYSFDFALLAYLPNAERPPMLKCLRQHIAVVGSMCRAATSLGDQEAVSRYKADLRHAAQAVLAEWINKMEVEGKPQSMSMSEYLGYGKLLPFAAAVVDGVDLRGPITSEAWHQIWHATQGTIGDYVGCQLDRGRAYFMPPTARVGVLPYTLREWFAARGVDCGNLGVVP